MVIASIMIYPSTHAPHNKPLQRLTTLDPSYLEVNTFFLLLVPD